MYRYEIISLEHYPIHGWFMVVKQVKKWWGWKIVSSMYADEIKGMDSQQIKTELEIRQYKS